MIDRPYHSNAPCLGGRHSAFSNWASAVTSVLPRCHAHFKRVVEASEAASRSTGTRTSGGFWSFLTGGGCVTHALVNVRRVMSCHRVLTGAMCAHGLPVLICALRSKKQDPEPARGRDWRPPPSKSHWWLQLLYDTVVAKMKVFFARTLPKAPPVARAVPMSPLHKHHRHFHPDTLQKAGAGRQQSGADARPRFDFRGLLEAFVQRVGMLHGVCVGMRCRARITVAAPLPCADPERHRSGSRVSVSLVLHAAELGDTNTLHPLYVPRRATLALRGSSARYHCCRWLTWTRGCHQVRLRVPAIVCR